MGQTVLVKKSSDMEYATKMDIPQKTTHPTVAQKLFKPLPTSSCAPTNMSPRLTLDPIGNLVPGFHLGAVRRRKWLKSRDRRDEDAILLAVPRDGSFCATSVGGCGVERERIWGSGKCWDGLGTRARGKLMIRLTDMGMSRGARIIGRYGL